MRIIFHRNTKEILAVIEDEDSTTSIPHEYAMLQADPETVAHLAAATGLDITQIQGIDMSSEELRVIARIKKCEAIKVRYLAENITISLTPEQSGGQLTAFSQLLMLLSVGDAKTALTMLTQIPSEAFLVTAGYTTTEERKETYRNELQQIIDTLFD